jgi:phenylacetate-CoA ligase
VMTSLYREAFPVVHFRTGDRVRYLGTRCPCGRPFAGIEGGTVARYDDMMKIRGQNLWPDAVDKIIFAKGDVEEYAGVVEIDQDARETVVVSLEFTPAAGLSTDEQARRLNELTEEILLKLNVRMTIRAVDYLSLPRFEFKVRRWTDKRRTGRTVVRYVKQET